MDSGEPEEFGGRSEWNFEGVSRGPGATLERALQQAAKAAADNGAADRRYALTYIEIEPQRHNQWVKAFRVIITPVD